MMLANFLRSDLARYRAIYGKPFPNSRLSFLLCFVNPKVLPVALYRVANACQRHQMPTLGKVVSWINFYINGVEISAMTEIGPGLFFPHCNGIVIGAKKIGENATIYQQVTIGAKRIELHYDGRPTIGDEVVIGAGAKVLGNLTIGNHCVIAANSLVTADMKSSEFAIGVPAAISPRKHFNRI